MSSRKARELGEPPALEALAESRRHGVAPSGRPWRQALIDEALGLPPEDALDARESDSPSK
jgi:hypothetical protein